MITQEQINNLKGGDKLIFFRDGAVLSTKEGNVFTFANWWGDGNQYWQCKELHDQGNHLHNFSIYDTELFDEKVHKDFVMMDGFIANILPHDKLDSENVHKKRTQ